MNDYPRSAPRLRSAKRARIAAFLCGTLLTLPGCGIPALRCPQPGPLLPDSYNWNNGAPAVNATAASDSLDSSVDGVRLATYSDSAVHVSRPPVNASEAAAVAAADAGDAAGRSADDATQESSEPSEPREAQGLGRFIQAASLLKLPLGDAPEEESAQPLDASENVPTEAIAPGIPSFGDSQSDFGESSLGPQLGPPGIALEPPGAALSAEVPRSAFFIDPYLNDLILQALVGNQELRILAEEIRIANNETYARSGEYRPFVSLGASAELEKPSRYTREGAVEEQLEVAPGREFPEPLPNFLLAADISWEVDIWKRLRNARDAAALRYLATQEGRNFVVTRLVAEISENYFDLLALDSRLQILDKTIEIQQRSLQIAEAQKAAGRGTELAVRRFEAEVRKAQSEKSVIAQEIVEVENRINFLVGRYPQPVERATVPFVDVHLHALRAGVPSQLLQNRADIRQAEREVAAAGLDVKVARARFYPSLTLTGGLGVEAFSTGYLFKTPESLIYGIAGELVGPLINKRAIQAAYSSANAAQLQQIYEYQQTVLEAHIEVVNYITRVDNYRRSVEVKRQQLESLEAAVESATQLFQSARAEYIEVLLAQRELMEARMELVHVKREQLAAIVNAYQALGGGGF